MHLESMVASRERAVAGVTSGLICLGQEVTWEAHHFGLLWRMTSRITAFDPPRRFVDEMVRGPFARFRHEHLFESHGEATLMTDVIEFAMPLGPVANGAEPLGPVANGAAGWYLRRLLATRNDVIRSVAEHG